MTEIIWEGRGLISTTPAKQIVEGRKYIFFEKDGRPQISYLKLVNEVNGTTVVQLENRETHLQLITTPDTLFDLVIVANEIHYPLHRVHWEKSLPLLGRIVEATLISNEKKEIIAHLKQIVLKSLDDIQTFHKMGILTASTAIRLAYKLGQFGEPILIRKYLSPDS